jgi:transcription antitermination protein NusB
VALYQHELTRRPLSETLGRDPAPFAVALAEGVVAHREELDTLIAGHSHGWSLERINPLERAIMRVALLEMLHPEILPGDAPIPAEGAIEEAVRSAKTFCGSDAPAFVNGVLDAVLREVRENTAKR